MRVRAVLAALLLSACSGTPDELPPPQLPQRAGVDPLVAARAEGVVFRAEGANFVLHLYRDNRIFVIWDAGAHQERFPASEPLLPAWAGEIYETRNERYQLRVEVRHAPCRDAAFGDAVLPRAVTVFIDNEERSGCGRAL
jgi:hypothetical protein